jgi:hypothetical protein
MNQLNLFPVLPELSDEAAVALFELLHELALVFESHYAAQIQRHMRHRLTPLPSPTGMSTGRLSNPPASRTALGSHHPERRGGQTTPSHIK